MGRQSRWNSGAARHGLCTERLLSPERTSLLRSLHDSLEDLQLEGSRLLVAVSGGIDSTVLAHALAELQERFPLALTIGHVNHGLRGEESRADQVAVEALAAELGVPVFARDVAPHLLREGGPSRARPTLQEAARRLRYRALLELATEAGCARVATAHNADDQAETVLLRLLRGCGPDGLGGIPERSHGDRVVRPLLGVSRVCIREYAESRGLRWREDRSNLEERYSRNRLRRRWLPALASDFNPQLLRTIGNLAEAHRRDAEWIETLVDDHAQRLFVLDDGGVLDGGVLDGGGMEIARGGWEELPVALARRLARRALVLLGGSRDVSRAHLDRFVRFLCQARPGTEIELPSGLRLTCRREAFRLHRDRVESEMPC